MRTRPTHILPALLTLLTGCAAPTAGIPGGDDNPFLDTGGGDKDDSGYVNLRGVEVEVTVEADLEAPAHRFFQGPADLAQFAVTFLRERHNTFIEILAEDADTPDRVLWQVGEEWISRAEAERRGVENLRRFRIPDVNVVLMNGAAEGVSAGSVIEATVPVRPYAVMEEGGQNCADPDGHISLSSDVYWYLWNPTRSGCRMETQRMKLIVEEVFPRNPESYPEYDQLLADGRIDAVVLFGKLDDGAVEDDYNWQNVRALARFLTEAGFAEQEGAPLGRRFEKRVGEVTEVVDIYGPDLFHSVADYSRLANWQRAVTEHEIVMYNGHSVLGSGMAFERVEYPDHYQIFQVASCLSYEYYVRPVLRGKQTWGAVDVLSNVQPTYYSENLPLTSTILAQIFRGAETGGRVSWQDIMEAVSRKLGHALFGVSGARDNCFSPEGDRCGGEPPPPPPGPGGVERHASSGSVAIPDNDRAGASSIITVAEGSRIGALTVELQISHSYVGDLEVVLTHDGVGETLWDQQGGSDNDIRDAFDTTRFAGAESTGEWKLTIIDHASVDTGTLDSWALVVTPAS